MDTRDAQDTQEAQDTRVSGRRRRVLIAGMDGFLGWPLALWLCDRGFDIMGVDNLARRSWVAEVNSQSVVPIATMEQRLAVARGRMHEPQSGTLEFVQMDIATDARDLERLLMEYKPDAIVHYAECPSAPYSMIDFDHAAYVQDNNTRGTLAILFAMKNVCPDALLLKLGTMGEYGTPMSGRPIFEGYFEDGCELVCPQEGRWPLSGELVPRNPGSIYHLSKCHDSLNIQKACQWWGLRSIDVMQGVIYGAMTPQTVAHKDLRTRLDVDSYFGTALNRFTAQAAVGYPLSAYGKGEQKRGFLALSDAMQCMESLILRPPERGEYEVVNQFADVYSINELARMVQSAAREFDILANIEHLTNPRVEAEDHPYRAVRRKLPEKYGFRPGRPIQDEIRHTLEMCLEPDIRDRIREVEDVMPPETYWRS